MTRAAPRARRAVLAALTLLLAVAALAPARGLGVASTGAARAVLSVAITVADVERSAAFFTDVLAFERIGDADVMARALDGSAGSQGRAVRLRLGHEQIALVGFPSAEGRPVPADSRSNDLWFQHLAIVVSDMAAAHARLVAHGVRPVSSAPQTLPLSNTAAAGITAFYFHDPDGHTLELIQYPAGKGDPRWHEASGRVFLGIDHTAIAVTDTDASLAFYRDRLGFAVVGKSLNVGVEQERLTGVTGARVRITGLRASAGPPGIELLEYEAPRDGRRLAFSPVANDLVYWRTTVAVGDAPTSTLVRDPDGHALELVGR